MPTPAKKPATTRKPAARAKSPAPPAKPTKTTTAKVVRDYFGAIASGDRDAQAKYYHDNGTATLHGQIEGDVNRDEIVDYFKNMYASFPDFTFEVLDLIADGDRAAVHWRANATFTGAPYDGIEANGAPVQIQGVDFVRVADGKLIRNDAFPDSNSFARQLGLLPAAGSRAQQRMTSLFNTTTRIGRRLAPTEPEPVADGVWVVRGGFPARAMNVYLVADGDGVMLFDAGIRSMVRQVSAAAATLGGITRVVLGHGHADHRGVAPFLNVPVICHPDAREQSEGDAGTPSFDLTKLNPLARRLMPRLLAAWDGGPVKVAETLSEGDTIAGFKVIDLPGHAPGLIALWRESDRLALSSDTFYTLDPQTGRKGLPRVPHEAFNADTPQARASIRKLAALQPAAAWPGHADALVPTDRVDVAGALEQAAATT